MGEWFEVICRQWLRFYAQDRLPSVAKSVGKIWADDYDIDVAGELLDGRGVAGECKWRRDATGANVLRELQKRAAANTFYASRADSTVYAIFARSPVTAELRRLASASDSIVVLTSAELVGTKRRKR